LSIKELVYIAAIVALVIFVTSISISTTEIHTEEDYAIVHFGWPFETATKYISSWSQWRPYKGHMFLFQFDIVETEIAWTGLLMDLVIFAPLSFVVVKIATRVNDEIYYYRYIKK
jgi:hypothetical protein